MSAAQETKREARAAAAAERDAEREHELAITKLILDRVATLTAKRGDIIVLTVPADKFIYPGTKPEDMDDERKAWMEQCHAVLNTLCNNLVQQGILPGGACILGEGMTLKDLPPPWEKHPDSEESKIERPGSRLLLPPGTRI